MKKFNKIVLLTLSLSACLISCNGGGNNYDLSANTNEHVDADKLYYAGNTHDLTAKDTDNYMVYNGQTEYKIIISSEASDTIKTARDEFIYFFEKATGITLTASYDTGLSHAANQKYISIGETTLFETSGITIDKLELGLDGVVIKSVDSNIYFVGGSDYGALNGVYDFMKICFNYEQYTHKVMEIDTGVRNLKFKDFNVKNIPDIPMRCHSYGFMGVSSSDYDQKMYGTRLRESRVRNDHRMPIYKDFDTSSYSAKSTNSNTVVPYDVLKPTHPKWFSDNSSDGKVQLCYTCHGDSDEYDALVDYVARKFEFSMMNYTPDKYPTLNCVLLMMEDNFNVCKCDACMKAKDKYGAESGAVVVFMNKVTEAVLEWQDRPENAAYKREDLKVCFNAYNQFEQSPTHLDENGNYVPNHPDMIMNDHLGVYFAEINNLDNQKSFFDEKNADGKAMFDGWAALTKWLELWVYETDFSCAMYFYDSFAFSTQQFYNYIASKNVKMIFSQGIDTDGHGGWTGVAWNQLKAYLNSKLTWDSTLNQEVLINNFFNAVYKDAAKSMKKLFVEMRSHYEYLLEKYTNLSCLRSIYNKFNDSQYDYYPLETLQSFLKVVDESLALVEKYKGNSEIYDPLFIEIEAQAIFPLYVILEMHSEELTPSYKSYIANRLMDDINTLNLSTAVVRESGSTILAFVSSYIN